MLDRHIPKRDVLQKCKNAVGVICQNRDSLFLFMLRNLTLLFFGSRPTIHFITLPVDRLSLCAMIYRVHVQPSRCRSWLKVIDVASRHVGH